MEEEAYISEGSDSAVELLDSEEDEPHSEDAYIASEVTDDGDDDDLSSQDDENEAVDTLEVAAVVSLPAPVAPAPRAPVPRAKKAAIVKRSKCNNKC